MHEHSQETSSGYRMTSCNQLVPNWSTFLSSLFPFEQKIKPVWVEVFLSRTRTQFLVVWTRLKLTDKRLIGGYIRWMTNQFQLVKTIAKRIKLNWQPHLNSLTDNGQTQENLDRTKLTFFFSKLRSVIARKSDPRFLDDYRGTTNRNVTYSVVCRDPC